MEDHRVGAGAGPEADRGRYGPRIARHDGRLRLVAVLTRRVRRAGRGHWCRAGAGHRRCAGRGRRPQVEDHRMRVRAARGGAAGVDRLAGRPQLPGCGAGVQDRAVGQFAAQPERAGTGRRGENGRRRGGRPAQGDVVQVHVAPVDGHPLAAQQGAQRVQVLAQQRERRFRARADLLHPALHPVADADRHPAGKQAVQHGCLHRGQRDVPQRDREHADPHPEPGRPGERRGGGGRGAAPEAVFPQPQLVQAPVLRRPDNLLQPLRRDFGPARHAKDRHAPILAGVRREQAGVL
jgi:hypothetical protein